MVPKAPDPIQNLPVELQELIIEHLTTYVRECRGVLTTSHPTHSTSTCGSMRVTDPSIIHLRATNHHFRALIPPSHSLLLAVERSSLAIKKKVWACCVCLKMKPYSQFATMKYGSWVLQESANLAFKRRHRFCFECGTRGADEQRSSTEPFGLTTYAPGTKLAIDKMGWVWCMDCRKVKTGNVVGEYSCRLFCKDCCARLGCRWSRADVLGATDRPGNQWMHLHWGYQATDPAKLFKEQPQDGRQDVLNFRTGTNRYGPTKVARSFLLPSPNDMNRGGVESDVEDGEWKAWFD